MNIDVREYLRINPISVHELTLSDNDNDCFLFFPTDTVNRGYQALTQNVLFRELQKSIFGGLLDSGGNIKTSGVSEADIAGKFINYVRKNAAYDFMQDFDRNSTDLESGLDNIILALRRKGILDYAGAVELQSNNARKLGWKLNPSDTTAFGPFYRNMSYAEGQIWCKSTDSNISTSGGSDEATIGNEPLRHTHSSTKAETLTGPLVANRGGSSIGKLTVGVKESFAQGTGFGPITGKISPMAHSANEQLTYPLWGQNVLDWRNPKKEHNNIPPSLNIYVRFLTQDNSSRGISESRESYVETIDCLSKIQKSMRSIGEDRSAAEAQHQSSMVKALPEYSQDHLTPNDYVLRILSDAKDGLQLMKQGLQMLLDVFTSKTNTNLSTSEDPMGEIMIGQLDGLLMLSSEFVRWYVQKSKQLDEIEKKIQIAKDLIVSVPPLNYIGRIIISYTDDTEQKVIAKYGGKRWRRIENFLRGVINGRTDAIEIPGGKLGEDFVALRESNIPIHQHSESLSSIAYTQHQEWAAKDKAGDVKIVNTTVGGAGTGRTMDISKVQRNYQISPLEYPNKGENEIALPHDNLPPYMKVYIWECTALTDYECQITGEPTNSKSCLVTWLFNGGEDSEGNTYNNQTLTIGGSYSVIPTPTIIGYTLVGWLDKSGRLKTNGEILANKVSGNETYVAQWKLVPCIVTFYCNGGKPIEMKKTYPYVSKIGHLPVPDEFPEGMTGFDGWYDDSGQYPNMYPVGTKVTENYVIPGNVTLTAHWIGSGASTYYIVKFYRHDGSTLVDQKSIAKGQKLGAAIPSPYAREGYGFKGWYTSTTGGTKATQFTVVNDNLNLYAQWEADNCRIVWDPNYSTGMPLEVWTRKYGTKLGTLPALTRTGATQNGWWTSQTGGNRITSSTEVNAADVTYYAHWNINGYTIKFNLAGGGSRDSIVVPYGTWQQVVPAEWIGHRFDGWTATGHSTSTAMYSVRSGVSVSMNSTNYVVPVSTNVSFCNLTPLNGRQVTLTARWNVNKYTISFDPSGGGTMPDETAQYGEWRSISAPLRTGYRFDGWIATGHNTDVAIYSIVNGVAVKMDTAPFDPPIAANGKVSFCNLNTGVASDNRTLLTAKWTANTYVMKFDLAGGGTLENQTVAYDTWKSISAPMRQGYHFTGWVVTGHSTSTAMYSVASGESVPMNRDSFTVPATGSISFKNLTPYAGRQITLTAKWEVNVTEGSN